MQFSRAVSKLMSSAAELDGKQVVPNTIGNNNLPIEQKNAQLPVEVGENRRLPSRQECD